MAARKPTSIHADPPDRLDEQGAQLWRELVARDTLDPRVTAEMLEAYCGLVVRWRDAAAKVAEEGLVVDGDKRGAIVHPALAVERQLAEQLREWAPMVNRPKPAARRRGPMYDATRRSINSVPELSGDGRYEGAREAVLTLAWLIDEAQRAGLEALQKATYNLIPSYLKGCAELQITPASLPADAKKKVTGGKLRKFEDAAAARRAQTAV